MSKKFGKVVEQVTEEVKEASGNIVEVVSEEVIEKKYFGKFTKKDLIKIGVGAGAIVGGVVIYKKIKELDYSIVEEVVESVEEIVGE